MYSFIKVSEYLEYLILVQSYYYFIKVIVWLYWFCNEKYWYVIFWRRLVFYQQPCLLFTEWKLPGAPTKVGFTALPWNFVHILYVTVPKTCVWISLFLFLFSFLKIYRFRKNMIFLTFFVGIAKENMCTKFQRKLIKLCWIGTFRNFDLFI